MVQSRALPQSRRGKGAPARTRGQDCSEMSKDCKYVRVRVRVRALMRNAGGDNDNGHGHGRGRGHGVEERRGGALGAFIEYQYELTAAFHSTHCSSGPPSLLRIGTREGGGVVLSCCRQFSPGHSYSLSLHTCIVCFCDRSTSAYDAAAVCGVFLFPVTVALVPLMCFLLPLASSFSSLAADGRRSGGVWSRGTGSWASRWGRGGGGRCFWGSGGTARGVHARKPGLCSRGSVLHFLLVPGV